MSNKNYTSKFWISPFRLYFGFSMQPSATHTNPSDKSSVEVIWEAPGDATSDVTIW